MNVCIVAQTVAADLPRVAVNVPQSKSTSSELSGWKWAGNLNFAVPQTD